MEIVFQNYCNLLESGFHKASNVIITLDVRFIVFWLSLFVFLFPTFCSWIFRLYQRVRISTYCRLYFEYAYLSRIAHLCKCRKAHTSTRCVWTSRINHFDNALDRLLYNSNFLLYRALFVNSLSDALFFLYVYQTHNMCLSSILKYSPRTVKRYVISSIRWQYCRHLIAYM